MKVLPQEMAWYNYKTREYEYISTPLDFHDYIPQSDAAINLYELYIEHMDLSPTEAAVKVLSACAGVKE